MTAEPLPDVLKPVRLRRKLADEPDGFGSGLLDGPPVRCPSRPRCRPPPPPPRPTFRRCRSRPPPPESWCPPPARGTWPTAPHPAHAHREGYGFDAETNSRYEEVKRGSTYITQLQQMTLAQLQAAAQADRIPRDEWAGLKKQDLIFRILKERVKQNGLMFGDGTLEVLPDGFGFLPSARTTTTCRARTTSTSRRRRSAGSACGPAASSPGRSARRRRTSGTSPCCGSRRSTTTTRRS